MNKPCVAHLFGVRSQAFASQRTQAVEGEQITITNAVKI
jgi:hypothetical protein